MCATYAVHPNQKPIRLSHSSLKRDLNCYDMSYIYIYIHINAYMFNVLSHLPCVRVGYFSLDA